MSCSVAIQTTIMMPGKQLIIIGSIMVGTYEPCIMISIRIVLIGVCASIDDFFNAISPICTDELTYTLNRGKNRVVKLP